MLTVHNETLLVRLASTRAPATVNGGGPMRMQVSPSVSRAPALVTVRITVEPAAENRLLLIVAESPDFYRSSQVEIDGQHPARQSVFEFSNLPAGLYQVTGILVGVHGRRAVVSKLAKVEPSIGAR